MCFFPTHLQHISLKLCNPFSISIETLLQKHFLFINEMFRHLNNKLVGGLNSSEKSARQIGSFPQGIGVKILQIFELPPPSTSRINPVSKWLVTPIYKPFRPFIYTRNNPIQKCFHKKSSKNLLLCLLHFELHEGFRSETHFSLL